jgi:hypothetical protein
MLLWCVCVCVCVCVPTFRSQPDFLSGNPLWGKCFVCSGVLDLPFYLPLPSAQTLGNLCGGCSHSLPSSSNETSVIVHNMRVYCRLGRVDQSASLSTLPSSFSFFCTRFYCVYLLVVDFTFDERTFFFFFQTRDFVVTAKEGNIRRERREEVYGWNTNKTTC